jgi:hypothetical protein
MTTYCGKKVKLNDPKLLETGISSFHHRYVADMDFAIHGWHGAFLVVWACLLRSMQGSWSRKMTRDDIIRLAREAGFIRVVAIEEGGAVTTTVAPIEELERFAALVAAAERKKVAAWMIERDYATGHDDTIEGLLKALEWQAKERARGFL